MALEFQTVSLSLSKGLSTKQDPKQVPAGSLLQLENSVFITINELRKRYGYTSLPNTISPGTSSTGNATLATGNSLSVFRNDLMLADGNNLFSFSPDEQMWMDKGSKTAVSISSSPVGALGKVDGNYIANTSITGVVTTLPQPTGMALPSVSSALHSSGVQLVAWVSRDEVDSNRIAYSFIDSSTNGIISTGQLGVSGEVPICVKVLVNGSNFYLLVLETISGGGVINCFTMPVANPLQASAYTPTALVTTTIIGNFLQSAFDAVTVGNNFYVAYNQAATTNFVLTKYDFATLTPTTVVVSSSQSDLVAVNYDGTTIWVIYRTSPGVTLQGFNASLAVTNAAVVIDFVGTQLPVAASGLLVNGNFIVYISYPNTVWQIGSVSTGPPSLYSNLLPTKIRRCTYNIATNTPNTVDFLNTVVLSARPYFDVDSSVIVPVQYYYSDMFFDRYQSPATNLIYRFTNQATYFLIKDSAPIGTAIKTEIMAKYSQSSAPQTYPMVLDSPINLSSGVVLIPYFIAVSNDIKILDSITNNGTSTAYYNYGEAFNFIYNINQIKITSHSKLRHLLLGANLNSTGGITTIYDGGGVAESGFHVYPEPPVSAINTGRLGSALVQLPNYDTAAYPAFNYIDAGTYAYLYLFRWTDAGGNIHRSAPGIGAATQLLGTTGGGFTNIQNLAVPGLQLSSPYKLPEVITEIYRTTNNGSIYYKVGAVVAPPGGFTTFQDTNPDSIIVGNQQLYTSGGEIENIAPPSFSATCAYENRVIGVQADNPYQWWFSKQIIQGFPAEYSDLLTNNIDQKGGPITALSTMDAQLVFFKATNIWYVAGSGPSANGLNSSFSYPQIISSDTGCINQDSVILTPVGLMFQSPKGIYLLDRGLALNYIGQPVEAYNNATVTSAVMIAETTQIRFTLSTGVCLVYDYNVGQWSIFTNVAAVDSVMYNSNHTFLTSTGTSKTQPSGTGTPVFTDDGAPISMKIQTGWFSFDKLQNFQRIKEMMLLGEYKSPTNLTITAAVNFNPAIVQTDVITLDNTVPLQYRMLMQVQKAQSIQFTIQDSPQMSYGEGLSLSSLAAVIGVKRGLSKVSSSRTYG